MLNLNEYFMDEYQFSLKEVTYNLVESNIASKQFEVKLFDTLSSKIIDRQLHITFCRKIYFEPTVLYHITVTFNISITFKDEINIAEIEFDWDDELLSCDTPYLSNVISRASNIIAFLTSSYGQQPLITPPVFIRSHD